MPRVNVSLPAATIRLMDRVARRGGRSRFIRLAVEDYVTRIGRARLRRLLKEGAIKRAERDLQIAGEFAALD